MRESIHFFFAVYMKIDYRSGTQLLFLAPSDLLLSDGIVQAMQLMH